jgi:hypothetical protein
MCVCLSVCLCVCVRVCVCACVCVCVCVLAQRVLLGCNDAATGKVAADTVVRTALSRPPRDPCAYFCACVMSIMVIMVHNG